MTPGHDAPVAYVSATPSARRRTIDASRAGTEIIDYDQWTVAGDFDRDRPLRRIVLHDDAGTIIYVSIASGTVVLAGTPDGAKAAVAVASAYTDASAAVKELAVLVGGGGGGSRDVAVAGGKDPAKLDDLLAEARRRFGGG